MHYKLCAQTQIKHFTMVFDKHHELSPHSVRCSSDQNISNSTFCNCTLIHANTEFRNTNTREHAVLQIFLIVYNAAVIKVSQILSKNNLVLAPV